MSVVLWLVAGFAFVTFFTWALCRAAANGDVLGDPDRLPVEWSGDQLPQVAHLCEARHRRDVRNGLGRAS